MSNNVKSPLTLALSPSAGEREQQRMLSTFFVRSPAFASCKYAARRTAILPLPFGRGEGRGEGNFA